MPAWHEAFSPSRNWALLFARPDSNVAFVDGFRGLAIIWTLVFHAMLFLGKYQPYATLAAGYSNPLVYLAMQAEVAVDAFFVLSGFLIARMIMRELARTGRLDISRFYIRRYLRLMPAYYAALALTALLMPRNLDMVWTNLLYLNNFVPYTRSFMGWAWSLAIEEQFYVVFPAFWLLLLALGRARLPLLAGLVVLGLALRAAAAVDFPPDAMPYAPPWFNSMVIDPLFTRVWELLYIKPQMRFGSLVIGVIAAYLTEHTDLVARLKAGGPLAGRLVALGLALTLGVMTVTRVAPPGTWPTLVMLPVGLRTPYLVGYHTLFALGTGCLMLACYAETGVAGGLRRFFAAQAWYPVAQLSYVAFLVNPLGFGLVNALAAPRFGVTAASAPLYWAAGLGLTLAVSLLLHLGLERPIMNLRS